MSSKTLLMQSGCTMLIVTTMDMLCPPFTLFVSQKECKFLNAT